MKLTKQHENRAVHVIWALCALPVIYALAQTGNYGVLLEPNTLIVVGLGLVAWWLSTRRPRRPGNGCQH